MRTIAVAGAGQIGTFVARELVRREIHVVLLDCQPDFHFICRHGDARFRVMLADLRDEAQTAAILREMAPEAVIMAAGVTAPAARSEEELWETNAVMPVNVARACVCAEVPTFVLISSRAVYGKGHHDPIREDAPCEPFHAYGRAKLAAEEQIRALAGGNLDVRVIRAAGVFGPHLVARGSHSSAFLCSLLDAAQKNGAVSVEATDETEDEYLYVKDLAAAVASVTLSSEAATGTFNAGPGVVSTARELKNIVEELIPGSHVDLTGQAPARRMAPLHIGKLSSVAGFTPQFPLRHAIADYISGNAP